MVHHSPSFYGDQVLNMEPTQVSTHQNIVLFQLVLTQLEWATILKQESAFRFSQ